MQSNLQIKQMPAFNTVESYTFNKSPVHDCVKRTVKFKEDCVNF